MQQPGIDAAIDTINRRTAQSTGDSTVNLMSQKAITDAIDEEIENRESEIERVDGLISDEQSARMEGDETLSETISQEIEDRSAADGTLSQSIANINAKIPVEATASNQLADKDFVHNEISTSSATFRGTYDTLAELEEQEADNNDYGFVVYTDTLGNTIYSRYKYNGTEWLWEYDINSTEFTQDE